MEANGIANVTVEATYIASVGIPNQTTKLCHT